MSGWTTVIGAIIQVIFYLMQSHASDKSDKKIEFANKAKEISDAISTGDISLINGVIGKLRK